MGGELGVKVLAIKADDQSSIPGVPESGRSEQIQVVR